MSETADQACPKCNAPMRLIREANAYECPACGAQQYRRSTFGWLFLGIGKFILIVIAVIGLLLGIAFVGCLLIGRG